MNNKTKEIRTMFTPQEHKKLKKEAFENDKPLRVYCRELILKGKLVKTIKHNRTGL